MTVSYYIEPAQDSYGNTGWGYALIEAHEGTAPHELVIDGPPEIRRKWPVTSQVNKLVRIEATGPARVLTYEEWIDLGGLRLSRVPQRKATS